MMPTRLLIILVLFLLPGILLANAAFKDEVISRIKAGEGKADLQVGEQVIYGSTFVASLYQSNGYVPAWDDDAITDLRLEIQDLKNDGLNPGDYWFPAIDILISNRQKADLDAASAVDLDMLLTEAFIRAYYNLFVGKVDPESLDDDFNFSRLLGSAELRPRIIAQLEKGAIADAFQQARPATEGYSNLKAALAQYRGYQQQGGWLTVQEGKTLKPGDKGVRVAQARARLAVTGDYTANSGSPELFDSTLEDAVKHFQNRHGLDADGAIGAKTIATMNVSVRQRIDQQRVNLERQRWYAHENQGEFIVTDIAGYYVHWIRDGELFWSAKAQVGTSYTQTPMFKDTIRYIEFNPTWTIPSSILARSTLPKLKKDPDYLTKKGYLLLTRDGKEVDPKSVNWSSVKKIPYIVRQPPGPDNALGLVKFMFPNKHAVYLHDTNHREHFADTKRSFSSGCVRVDNPFDLAEKLLAGQGDWNRQKIDEVVASGKTTRVNLEKPVRIIIAYGTASMRDGQVYFREDVYDRDAKVLKALDAPFRVRAQDAAGRAHVSDTGKYAAD